MQADANFYCLTGTLKDQQVKDVTRVLQRADVAYNRSSIFNYDGAWLFTSPASRRGCKFIDGRQKIMIQEIDEDDYIIAKVSTFKI